MDNAIFPNKFKAALAAHQVQIGCWCALVNPISTEVLGLAGFDWLVLDAEHAPNDVTTLIPQLMALKGSSVRRWSVCRPMNPSSSSACWTSASITSWCCLSRRLNRRRRRWLRPVIRRKGSAGSPFPTAAICLAPRPDYFAQSNKNISILVQIESQTGVDNVEAIAATEGVDGVFVGPSDLAAALGHLGNAAHPEVQRAIHISSPARRSTVSQAAFWRQWKPMRAAIWNGARPSAAVGSDLGVFRSATQKLADAFKK